MGLPYEAAINKVKRGLLHQISSRFTEGWRKELMRWDLKDTGLLLLPTDISNDLIDVGCSHRVNLRHIAELPMMGSDAVGRRTLERRITVMIGLIDLMD